MVADVKPFINFDSVLETAAHSDIMYYKHTQFSKPHSLSRRQELVAWFSFLPRRQNCSISK